MRSFAVKPEHRPLHSPTVAKGNMPQEPDWEEEEEKKQHKRTLCRDRQRRKRERDKASAMEAERQMSSVFFGQQQAAAQSYHPAGHSAALRWPQPGQQYALIPPHCLPSQPLRTSTASHQPLALPSPALSQASTESISTVVLSAQANLNHGEPAHIHNASLRTPFQLDDGNLLVKKRKRATSNVSAPSYIGETRQARRVVQQDIPQAIQAESEEAQATPRASRPRPTRSHSSPSNNIVDTRQTPQRVSRPRHELAMTPLPSLGFTSTGTSYDSPLCSPHVGTAMLVQPSDRATLFASTLLRAFGSADNEKLRDGVMHSLEITTADLEAMRGGIASVFDAFMAKREEGSERPRSSAVASKSEAASKRPTVHQRSSSESVLKVDRETPSAPYHPPPLSASASLPAYAYVPTSQSDPFAFATPVQTMPRHRYMHHVGNFSAGPTELPGTPTPGSQVQHRPQAQPRALAYNTPTPSHSPIQYIQPISLPAQPGTPYEAMSDPSQWQTPLNSNNRPSYNLMSGYATDPRPRDLAILPAQPSPCILPSNINQQQ